MIFIRASPAPERSLSAAAPVVVAGAHANATSGQPRFVVRQTEEEWRYARFEHALYRHHVMDPLVSGAGPFRFEMECGPTGAYTPAHYRSFVAGYGFE